MCSKSNCVCTPKTPPLPADWAIKEALNRAAYPANMSSIKAYPATFKPIVELARMIETHEKPPVDPLLLKAREIYKEAYLRCHPAYSQSIDCINKGEWDSGASIQAVLTALRLVYSS